MSTWLVQQSVRCLAQGGVIAYPTEAVYGLGCDPDNQKAVERLLAIKQRPWQKGLILIAASWTSVSPYLLPLSSEIKQQITRQQQRPTTWLLPAHPNTPKWLTGESDLLAVRVTSHPLARQLCDLWGKPLVSTSANRAGKPALSTALQVRLQLGLQLDNLLVGTVGSQSRPSEIRNALTGKIIRA